MTDEYFSWRNSFLRCHIINPSLNQQLMFDHDVFNLPQRMLNHTTDYIFGEEFLSIFGLLLAAEIIIVA